MTSVAAPAPASAPAPTSSLTAIAPTARAPTPTPSTSLPQNQSSTTTQPQTHIQTRLENTTLCVPIVYGSMAFPLPKNEEYNTHRWTLFVRGPNNEDLSQGIAKVVFQLHPSFEQPVRELTAPPFEVTEKGWGEFEASVRIVWRDPAEKALVLMHMIKLYPPIEKNINVLGTGTGVGDGGTVGKEKKEGEPVIHEFYDEVVFTDPTETFHQQLLSGSMSTGNGNIPKVESQEPRVQEYFKPYSDEEDFKQLLEAQKFLENELISVKDRILRADCAKNELERALTEVAAKAKTLVQAVAAPASAAPVPAKRKKPSGGASKKSKTTAVASAATINK